VGMRLDDPVPPRREQLRGERVGGPRLPLSGWLAVIGALGLVAASESLFVTFGPWLKDEFGASDAALAGVTFGLGGLELAASGLSATRTDRWGKERSVTRGATVMIAAVAVFLAVNDWAVPGMILVAVFIASFEFCIVSAIPIGGDLVAGRPGRGIGFIMAAATTGRAVTTIPTTWLYDHVGIRASALLAAGWALVGVTMMALRLRMLRPPAQLGVSDSRW
jgi:predicted MFS family arabinose efflux permease